MAGEKAAFRLPLYAAALPVYKMSFALSEIPTAKEATDLVIDGRIPDHYARHYDAIPAWRLNCLYLGNAKDELPERDGDVFEMDTNKYATLLINAQTGDMMDRTRTDAKQCALPNIIPW